MSYQLITGDSKLCFVFWHKGKFHGWCRMCKAQPKPLVDFKDLSGDRSIVKCPDCHEAICQESYEWPEKENVLPLFA